MRWVKQSKRGFAIYRPYQRSDYVGLVLAFVVIAIIVFIRLDSYFFIGIGLLSSLFLLVILRPTAFCVNTRNGLVINEFFKRYPVSDLEIIEKKAIIRNLLIDLSHLSDEEMAYIKERIPDSFIEPDGTSPEAVYVNHFIMRAIESKEQVRLSRANLVSIPEHDIDAAGISFDDIKAHCKKVMSFCNPLHVVWHKEPKQEAYIKFVIDEDHVYISVVTKQAE
jgi:hypothetical protein